MSYRARHDPAAFLGVGTEIVQARIVSARGSTPRAAGTWMLISQSAVFETIGGGALELRAIEEARAMLAGAEARRMIDQPLGPEIGQCCGGRVRLMLERLDPGGAAALIAERQAELDALPEILIFGAGPVGAAIARALAQLPARPVLIDSRAEHLRAAIEGVERRLTAVPEAELRCASPGAATIIATHDHALDFLLAAEALRHAHLAYIGMIGSKTKRARFHSWIGRQAGAPLDRLICPIGAGAVASEVAKQPEVIAALVCAELLPHFGSVAPNIRTRQNVEA